MAKLITKFKYIKPGNGAGSYLKYIATREGVEKIDDSKKLLPTTAKQKILIAKLLRDFPDSREMLEYEDYRAEKTIGAASEFITRAIEDNAHSMMTSKTYADYIATRPRAERFGSHGLFTDDGVEIKLTEVSEELNRHEGNVWTAIMSLRREDAERLGFNRGARWRDMLRTQTQALSENLKIPMENLRWYAAFHNESHHPHVHLIAYSLLENEGYLTKKGVENLRSSFARDIFAQDLLSVYEQQTEHRDALRAEGKKLAEEIAAGIHAGSYDNPVLENKLTELAGRLARTGGKKVYGYLKADVKDLIDNIVDELAKDERIASLYSLWYEKREEVLKTYTMDMPARLPLSRNPEFKPIRNAVIQAAMEIMADRVMEDGAADEGAELSGPEAFAEPERSESEPVEADIPFPTGGGSRRKKTWWTDKYKTARSYLYGTKDVPPNFKKAFEGMQEEAASGNGLAMYDLGRMHLSGLGCEKDEDAAQEWFAKAYQAFLAEEGRAKKPGYMQYRIGKLFSFGYGVEQDYLQAAAWYEKAVANENPFAAYALASLYRRGQGVEQDNAEAFRLYTMAASDENSPNAYAAYELGRMYKDGVGTTADKAASESWYRKAYLGFLSIERQMADDKLYYRLGQMNLTGTGTEKDLDLAREYFEKAAALDNADALYGLGKLYLDPRFAGCSAPRAVDYLFAAAQKGHDYGQYALGRLFLAGEVVPKNPAYALIWLEKAVKQENPAAEYLLGKALLLGEDAPQDLARGEALLNRAIENGHEYAAYVLGKAYLEGSAVAQDIPKAIGYLTMAAEKGAAPAEYALGKLFYQGEAVPKDVGKALYHLESAAEKDHPYAAYLAGKIRLSEEGYLDVEKAVRLFEAAAALGNDFAEYQLGKLYLYGKDVSQNMEAAVRWLTASAEHGNQYAAQLLHSVRNNKNLSVAMASLRLLHHISRMIQNRLEDERRGKGGTIIERKLRRQIEEKKQALGIRL